MDISEFAESVYIGAVVGGGVEMAFSPIASLLIQGRYTLGLTSLVDDAQDPGLNLTVRDFNIQAGVSFHPGS